MAFAAARLLTAKSIVPWLEFGGSTDDVAYATPPLMQIGVISAEDQILMVGCHLTLSNKGDGYGADEAVLRGLEYAAQLGVSQRIQCMINHTSRDINVYASLLPGATGIRFWTANGRGSFRVLTRADFTHSTAIDLSGHYRLAE